MQAFLTVIGVLVLSTFTQTVESTYYAFTYNNGIDNEEHCCLARTDKDFCLAKPLTSSLIQVNKECQRLAPDDKGEDYLSKIVRRLNIDGSKKIGDKILLELKTPLEENILKRDLLCLKSANNDINIEKCFIELAKVENKSSKKKRSHEKEPKKNETVEQVVVEEQASNENDVQLLEIGGPIKILEGQGPAVYEVFDLNLTDFRPSSSKLRECWSWYRSYTKQLCSHPKNFKNTCVTLNPQREKCLEKLFYKKITEEKQEPYVKNFIPIGSKLFCEDNNQIVKLLGYHRLSDMCFETHTQIYIQHKFTDFLGLGDLSKNANIFKFIAASPKLVREYEEDCHDKIPVVVEEPSPEEKETESVVEEPQTDSNVYTEDKESVVNGEASSPNTKQ